MLLAIGLLRQNNIEMGIFMRILIAEDEKEVNSAIVKRLTLAGYSVDFCFNGQEVLEFLACAEYDVIILDIIMPKLNGLEVLHQLRLNRDHTPVLLLTARDSISNRVEGLDKGADDYLIKPFDFDELLARIRVILRKSAGNSTNKYQIANLTLDCNKHKVFRDTVEIILSAKEFSLLEYLVCNKEKVLSREKIQQHIWNYDYMGSSNIIDVYIRYLRKKIDDQFEPKLIHTVRGKGYVLREQK